MDLQLLFVIIEPCKLPADNQKSLCTTTELAILLTSCLIDGKGHVMKIVKIGTMFYKHIVLISIGTNCALVDVFLFCYESLYLTIVSVIEAFNSTIVYGP